MSMSIPEFWKLVIESHLLSAQQCQQLGAGFGNVKGAAAQSSARTLAEWLVAEGALSRYQAMVLLAGRAGPFFYGEYKVYDRIESGRFQGNFRAVHVLTHHPVQLQFLTGPTVQDAQQWAMLATLIQHRFLHPSPYVQRYFDLVDAGSFKFMVAEDLAGDTLEGRLRSHGRLPPAEAFAVVREAALGTAHLHQLGLTHGSLSPHEIWVGDHRVAKLLHDPSRPVAPLGAFAHESPEEFAHRADYAAPELAHPQKAPDSLTDIYALGCVLFQATVGHPPFAGGGAQEKLQRHAAEAIQSLAPLGVPPAGEQVVMYLMAKNSAVRYQQAQQVADQLAALCEPARLQLPPAGDPPTLNGYESHLRQRWAAGLPLAGPPTSAPTAAGSTSALQTGGLPTGTATTSASKPASSTSSAPSVGVAPQGPKSSTKSGGKSEGAKSSSSKPAGGKSEGAKPSGASAPGASKASGPGSVAAGAASPGKGTHAPLPAGVAPGSTSEALGAKAPSATERLREGSKAGPKNQLVLVGSLAAAAAVVVIGLIVVLNMGDKPTPNDGEVAVVDDSPNGSSQGNTSTGAGGSQPTPNTSNPLTQPAVAGKPSGKPNEKPVTGVVPKPGDLPGVAGKPAGDTKVETKPESAIEQVVVADDGASLWASPTTGPPIELDLVPLDAHFLLHVRAASLMSSDEGPKFVQACGPALQNLITQWETGAGVKLNEVDRLLFSLHDNGDDWPRPAVVVRLSQPLTEEELVAKWGNPAAVEVKNGKMYQGAGWNYYVPAKPLGVFVMGSAEDVKSVVESRGAPPPLRRELGVLRRLTDVDRHVTLLGTPNFIMTNLMRDGRTFYFGEAKRLREPIDWFLKDELQAFQASLHFADDTYVEMRMIGTQGKDKFTLAKEVRERLSQVPELLFEYIATLGSNPYWERVRLRYPGMITFLHAKSRIGADADTATINSRLPRAAAHNLAFGTEMVLVSTPGAPAVASVAAAGPAKPTGSAMTIEDILFKHVTSMSFEAQSLEFAIQDVAKDVNETLKGLPFEFKIKILGEDLQLDGITRNQTVRDFMHKDKTVGDILTAMVMKANSPAAPDPSSPAQKLLWVIDKDPEDPSKPIVLVTTRAASEKKKFTLPMQFRPK